MSARCREQGVDCARGIAVMTMVWVHFVPVSETGASFGDAAVRWSVNLLDGLPAALFLLLVGVAAGCAGTRPWPIVCRRAIGIALVGVSFWWFVWPNDVLVPIAVSILAVASMQRLGAAATWCAVLALLVMVPVATELWGDYVWYVDIREDGTHEANHSVGWHTVRYFLFDGAYPLLPWLCFPLVGLRLAAGMHDSRARRRWAVVAAMVCAVAVTLDRLCGDAWAGGLWAHLAVTWQPTSLPFVAAWGGGAVLVVLLSVTIGSGRCERLGCVGRASLTHYLLHLVVVYGALRLIWPDEDWPRWVGLSAACGYGAFAWLGSRPWIERFGRGPLESLVHCWSLRATLPPRQDPPRNRP
ncbi:MAG TPA: DUF418 domain-containing protein [bacterium]|nr:DUF418 domain-containing protein [bacterium]